MADFETIPQEAIDQLYSNPQFAPQFDTVFGAGRAAELIEAQAGLPEPENSNDDDWTVVGETFRAIGGGARDAIQETGNSIQSIGESVGNYMTGGRDLYWTEEAGFEILSLDEVQSGSYTIPEWQTRDLIGDEGTLTLPEVADNKTFVGGMGRGIAQFTTGYFTGRQLTGLKGLKGAFVNGALADAFAFDPEDPNLTAALGEFGVDTGEFGEIMASDPEDPEYINRLRNAGEGALLGGILEGVGWSIRALRATKSGDTAGAAEALAKRDEALKVLDEAIEEGSAAVQRDVQETLDMAKTIFPDEATPPRASSEPRAPTELDVEPRKVDADGQGRLDLGDTPAPTRAAPDEVSPNRIYNTPVKAERIRYGARLAAGMPIEDNMAAYSFKSLNTMKDWDDVANEMASVAHYTADEFTKIRGGDVQRWSQVKLDTARRLRQLVDMGMEDSEKLIKEMQSANLGEISQMAAEVRARSTLVLTVEQDLKEMAQAITTGVIDPKRFPHIKDMDHMRLAFNQRREIGTNVLAGQDALRSNIGRAMNAMKMAVEGDEMLQQMLRDPATFRDIDAVAKAIADPKNADASALKTSKEALEKIHGYMDRINSFRINALLSGPGTQEVNIVSNALNSFAVPFGQGLGAVATGDRKMVKHALRQFQGSFTGWADAVKTAGQAGWWDEAVLDPLNSKIEDDSLRGLITGHEPTDKVLALPSRALMTMDEFFKQASYRGRIFADAHMEATEQGLKGTERAEFIQNALKDAYDEKGVATNGEALLQAQRTTFTEALEPGSFGAAIQSHAVKHPTMRFVVPFVRTPINILSQTLQHMPGIGFASKRLRDDFAAGGVRAAQAKGRQALGTALVGLGLTAAATGNITGAGPSNPAVRRAWLKNNQPYSFRIENEDGTVEWMSYARFEPLSNILSIFADVVEIKNDEYNEAATTGMVQAVLISVMNNSVNKTFTQGIYDAMAIAVGRNHERKSAVNNLIASFVPNVLNQTNGDDTLRETRTLIDALLAKTHLYNQVDPKRNVLGEPVLRTLPKYDPLGLTEADVRETDNVMAELTRVGVLNQTTIGNPARRIPGPNRIDISTVPYSESQSVYDRWVELTGTVEIGGKTLREELEEVMSSNSYQRTPDGFIGASSGTKGTIIQRVVSRYRDKAKSELPELQEIIRSERRGGATLLRGQAQANRTQLFPSTTTDPVAPRRRTFEDLLGQ